MYKRQADSFAKLAETYSEDPGSNTNGGFYKVTQSTSFFADFKNWCLDESRQSGEMCIRDRHRVGLTGPVFP